MAEQAHSTTLSVKDLLNLSTRLRDAADDMLSNRALAADVRQAADLVSRWGNVREGWENPDLTSDAIHELGERINDWAKTGEAVRSTDVFLAMCVVDMFVRLLTGESLQAVMERPVVL